MVVDVAGTVVVVVVAVGAVLVVNGVVGATVDGMAVDDTAVAGTVVSVAGGAGAVVMVVASTLHSDSDSRRTAINVPDRPTSLPLTFPSNISTERACGNQECPPS